MDLKKSNIKTIKYWSIYWKHHHTAEKSLNCIYLDCYHKVLPRDQKRSAFTTLQMIRQQVFISIHSLQIYFQD